MLKKINWISVLLGILFAMFILPMVTARFGSRATSSRTA